jgi:hypothetical protein
MNYEPPEFQRCTGKPLTLDMQMGKAPINGTYECKTCHRFNAPSHPASATPASWIDPWPDFTPCCNFVPMKWADPVGDEEILQMVLEELPTLPTVWSIKSLVVDGLITAAVQQIKFQSGWTVTGFDNEARIRRALLCDKVIHEYRRRKHDIRTL